MDEDNFSCVWQEKLIKYFLQYLLTKLLYKMEPGMIEIENKEEVKYLFTNSRNNNEMILKLNCNGKEYKTTITEPYLEQSPIKDLNMIFDFVDDLCNNNAKYKLAKNDNHYNLTLFCNVGTKIKNLEFNLEIDTIVQENGYIKKYVLKKDILKKSIEDRKSVYDTMHRLLPEKYSYDYEKFDALIHSENPKYKFAYDDIATLLSYLSYTYGIHCSSTCDNICFAIDTNRADQDDYRNRTGHFQKNTQFWYEYYTVGKNVPTGKIHASDKYSFEKNWISVGDSFDIALVVYYVNYSTDHITYSELIKLPSKRGIPFTQAMEYRLCAIKHSK